MMLRLESAVSETNAVAVIIPVVFTLVPDPNAVLIPVSAEPSNAGKAPLSLDAVTEVNLASATVPVN